MRNVHARCPALVIALTWLALRGAIATPPSDDAWIAAQPRFHSIANDPAAVDRLLTALHLRFPTFGPRLRAVAMLRLGTPYVLGCLGEGSGHDPQPVFRLDQSDCTVHVLTSVALAQARTWDEARAWTVRLNYHPAAGERDARGVLPRVGYDNRIHFTEDRLTTTPWFKVVDSALVSDAPPASVSLTLNRTREGKRLIDIPWEMRTTVRYLRTSDVTPAVLARLPAPVAGVAFVRAATFPLGLAVGHEGLVVDRRWLVHADSITKRTVKVDLLSYLRKNADWFDGVIFSRIVP